MQAKVCDEIKKDERLFLDPGMEFKVLKITRHGINDKVHNRYIECLEFHLDDGIEGYEDDATGEMSIVRDPQDTLMVLDENEEAPQVHWKGPND